MRARRGRLAVGEERREDHDGHEGRAARAPVPAWGVAAEEDGEGDDRAELADRRSGQHLGAELGGQLAAVAEDRQQDAERRGRDGQPDEETGLDASSPSTPATNAPRASAATNVMPHPVRARRNGPPRMRCRSISSPARYISVHSPSWDRKLMMSSSSAHPRAGPMRMPARISMITAGIRTTGATRSASSGASATAVRMHDQRRQRRIGHRPPSERTARSSHRDQRPGPARRSRGTAGRDDHATLTVNVTVLLLVELVSVTFASPASRPTMPGLNDAPPSSLPATNSATFGSLISPVQSL